MKNTTYKIHNSFTARRIFMKYIFMVMGMLLAADTFANSRLISIKGYGTIEVEADVINISFSVANTDSKDIATAKRDVEIRSSKIVDALLELGVSAEDISSPNFHVAAEPRYGDDDCLQYWRPEVERVLEVRIKEISKYGAALDALVSNGVSSVDTVEPEVFDIKKRELDALSVAIEDAKQQAAFLAKSFGETIHGVYSIGERKYRNRHGLEEIVMTGIRASKRKNDEMPYEFKPGKIIIEADIYVEFELE